MNQTFGPQNPAGLFSLKRNFPSAPFSTSMSNQMNTSTPNYNAGGLNLLKTAGNVINQFKNPTVGAPILAYNPSIPSSPMLSTGIMGQQANNPQSNVKAPTNTLNTSQKQKTQNTGGAGSKTKGSAATGSSATGSTATVTPPPVTTNSAPVSPVTNAVNTAQNMAAGANAGTTNTANTGLFNKAFGQNPAQPYMNTLGNISQNNTQEVNQAYDNLANFNRSAPLLEATQANIPMASNVSAGRGQVLGNELSGIGQGLANTYNAAVQGEGQQVNAAAQGGNQALTGQQQQIGALNEAGNLGIGQQGVQNTALANLLGYVPEALRYGSLGNGGLFDPSSQANNLAQSVISGNMTYDQAVNSMGYAGNAGQTFLNNAIRQLNPNFNIPQATGQAQGIQQFGGNLVQMQSANTAAKGIQGTIQQFLNQNPNLNPSGFTAGNNLAQWLSGKQLGDPNYQTLADYLNEYASTLAPILGIGGDPTNLKTTIAQSFVNGAASGQSISQVLNNISSLADNKIANLQSGATGGGQVAGPTPASQTQSSGQWPGWNPK